MSNRNHDKLHGLIGPGKIIVDGSFVPLTGAGTVDATKVTGLGFGYAPVKGVMALITPPQNNPIPLSTPGIVRTGTGLYTITFEDPYLEVVSFRCDLAVAAAGSALRAVPVEPITGTSTANTAPTITIVILNGATPTDAAASQRVHFHAVFRDSTTRYQKP